MTVSMITIVQLTPLKPNLDNFVQNATTPALITVVVLMHKTAQVVIPQCFDNWSLMHVPANQGILMLAYSYAIHVSILFLVVKYVPVLLSALIVLLGLPLDHLANVAALLVTWFQEYVLT